MNRFAAVCWFFMLGMAVLSAANNTVCAQSTGVSVQENKTAIILNNGLIKLTFSKPYARITSIIDEMGSRHLELLNTSIGMYFDANGGRLHKPRHLAGEPRRRSYFVPLRGRGCRVIRDGDQSAEVIFKAAPSFWFPFAIQAHFELRRGQSGFYAWVIYHHQAGTPGGSIAQTRFVIKAADGHSVFTHWAVDKYAVQSPFLPV